jgi:hypothetical protein
MSSGTFTFRSWSTAFSTLGAITAGVTLFFAPIHRNPPDEPIAVDAARTETTAKQTADLSALKRRVDAIVADQNGQTPPKVLELKEQIDQLARRQKLIEDAISRDPAKALELPLMRRDLDNLKESQIQSANSVKQSVDQVYDLNKWLFGGMALSVFAVAIGNLLRGRSRTEEEG